ncbi:ATP-binding protein [Sphingomonadaceae bacterium OTU29LAMAA1]|nr:ATP-binding protein [Sphingomonadaceae bacterium OTU29LAMAA1]
MTNLEDMRALPDGSRPTSISVRAVDAYADYLPQLHLRARPDGVITFLNLRYEELTGADRCPAVREALWRDRIHPEDLDGLEGAFAGGQVGDRDLQIDFRLLHADGAFRWMRLTARIVQDEAGDLVWHGLASDVQDERAARGEPDAISRGLRERVDGQAAELASLEVRYASLFAISRIAFAEQDMSGTALILRDLKAQGIEDLAAYMAEHPETLARCVASVKTVSVNDACVRMLGFDDVDGAVDRTVDGTAEDIEAVLLRQFEMIFYGWESVEGRVVLIGARGRRVPVFYSVTRLDDERQLSSLVDISSQEEVEEMRRAAQAELARASRIATVGAFSASIAHELNQPVASISMDANTGLRLLRRPQPEVGAAVRVLERVSVTIERISTIVRHTHDRIQGGRQDVRRIDLGRLARETCALLARDMRSCGVSVRYVGSDAPAVEGDFVDLQQVLINLINNARDAMLDVERDEKVVTVDVRGVGDHVELAVADVGAGISEDDRTRLFQPFFTTKKEGVGLGLQICLSTIQRMGGEMTVANGPSQGAVFTCRLPALRG